MIKKPGGTPQRTVKAIPLSKDKDKDVIMRHHVILEHKSDSGGLELFMCSFSDIPIGQVDSP